LAERIIRLWKIEDITPRKSTVLQSLLRRSLPRVFHQLLRAVDSKNRDSLKNVAPRHGRKTPDHSQAPAPWNSLVVLRPAKTHELFGWYHHEKTFFATKKCKSRQKRSKRLSGFSTTATEHGWLIATVAPGGKNRFWRCDSFSAPTLCSQALCYFYLSFKQYLHLHVVNNLAFAFIPPHIIQI